MKEDDDEIHDEDYGNHDVDDAKRTLCWNQGHHDGNHNQHGSENMNGSENLIMMQLHFTQLLIMSFC